MNDLETTTALADIEPDHATDMMEWPTATQTWLRYFYIGRMNYLKGLAVASVIAVLCASIWSPTSAYLVMALAVGYVAVSGAGLYLLYGPPSESIFSELFQMAGLKGNERVVDIHFGTWRFSRATLEQLCDATVHAVGVHDPQHESEPAVRDVWKFERPPNGHDRFQDSHGRPGELPVDDQSADAVILGFGIHEVHSEPERRRLMREIKRILAPGGKVLLAERGWSPLLLLVFGPLFLHFTPAKEWNRWLRQYFQDVRQGKKFGMVDLFVAEAPIERKTDATSE